MRTSCSPCSCLTTLFKGAGATENPPHWDWGGYVGYGSTVCVCVRVCECASVCVGAYA